MSEIAIHGLGYVGLTAAVHFAQAGWTVTAYDPDKATIDALAAGTPRVGDFLEYLNADVAGLVSQGLIRPTVGLTDTFSIGVHLVAVPSECDGEPDMSIVKKVVARLLDMTQPGTVILIESTLTPGTVDEMIAEWGDPDEQPNRFLDGKHLAICPRRDWFADPDKNLATLPRVVGGVTPGCTDRAVDALVDVSPNILLTDYRTAEVTKALENAWLHALVMLPTELAMNRPDLDIAQAVELASTHWRLPEIFLGAGCGGRCVPIGTKYLLGVAGPGGILEAVARNERHIRCEAARAISRRAIQAHTGDGPARVLILGAAYRPGFRDIGMSPGLDLAKYLRGDFGCEVHVDDPCWSRAELEELTGFSGPQIEIMEESEGRTGAKRLPADPLPELYSAVVLATPHKEYIGWPSDVIWRQGQVIFDTQGAWAHHASACAIAGVEYVRLGTPGWQ